MTQPNELVERAMRYAIQAHQRIDQQRKYTGLPYDAHLRAVTAILATVSDDPEMLAAAWLHDVVEDTPATIEAVRAEFGENIACLVAELTDVSRPGDGNRAMRKALDRQHLSRASARAKTVKLADLIDNCRDICAHDPRFAPVYLAEMAQLLPLLAGGDARLFAQANAEWRRCAAAPGMTSAPVTQELQQPAPSPLAGLVPQGRALRLFVESFSAGDIAEPLASFDFDASATAVAAVMLERSLSVAGVRSGGEVRGYVLPADLGAKACGAHMREFRADQVLGHDAPLFDVIHALTRHDHGFVESFGQACGVLTRADMHKPVVRMWLFGIVTMLEMAFAERIRRSFPAEGWHARLSAGRLAKAEELLLERRRRGQACTLLDCLQFSDKASILVDDAELLALFGFDSKKTAKRVAKDLESLRNNLAHAQDIVTHDWPQIARLARQLGALAGGG